MELVNLMDLNIPETEQLVTGLGEPRYRADQVFQWIHRQGVTRFAEMTNLPLGLRSKLETVSCLGNLTLVTKKTAADGTAKYLFGLRDGQAVESVLLAHDYGRGVCISCQVGCRMGCRFCASTIGGLVRNLTAGEMYAQVMGVRAETGKKISNVVVMGSGEPLDNLSQVLKFIDLITSAQGLNIGSRRITVSTCGVVPGIRQLAGAKPQVTLSVSLHAPDDATRDRLMPINRKYPLQALLEACREYIAITNRRITFEYILIDGCNDSPEQAGKLGRLLQGLLCHVNLIPLNEVPERGFQGSKPAMVRGFQETLVKMGVPVTVRQEMGTGIEAACGQLRRRAAWEQPGPERR